MLLVTGGGGFIGSARFWALNEAGRADIVIVDCFGHDEKWRNIAKRDFFEIVAIEKLPAWLDRFGRDPREFCVTTKRFVGDDRGRVKELHTMRVEWVRDNGKFGIHSHESGPASSGLRIPGSGLPAGPPE